MHRCATHLSAAPGYIFALECRRRGKNDIGVARGCRPERFIDDDGLGFAPGFAQSVEVLVVMERIAARPVDQLDVGKGQCLAVERNRRAGVEQHVGNARHRNERRHRVAVSRQFTHLEWKGAPPGEAKIVDATIAVTHTLPWCTQVAEHRTQYRNHPIRLVAVLGPLQRPADGQQGRFGCHAPRQLSNPFRFDLAQRCCPVGIFGDPVGFAY